MTQEDKQLLLKDLCARFPYGVNVLLDIEKQFDGGSICTLTSIDAKTSNAIFHVDVTLMDLQIEEIRPYLRPMSSMTEEEKSLFLDLRNALTYQENGEYDLDDFNELQDFLNRSHFDWRGLIPMGLALPAPEGMYTQL